eukprot:3941940-Rhodomonas_salina.2
MAYPISCYALAGTAIASSMSGTDIAYGILYRATRCPLDLSCCEMGEVGVRLLAVPPILLPQLTLSSYPS